MRNLDLPAVDSRLRALDEQQKTDAAALADRWALGAAMTRIVEALDSLDTREAA